MRLPSLSTLLYKSTRLPCDYNTADRSLVDKLIAKKLILPSFQPDAPVPLRARVSSPPLALRRTRASGRNVGKISFFTIKLSTREHSATFHDHRSNWEFIWRTILLTMREKESSWGQGPCLCWGQRSMPASNQGRGLCWPPGQCFLS